MTHTLHIKKSKLTDFLLSSIITKTVILDLSNYYKRCYQKILKPEQFNSECYILEDSLCSSRKVPMPYFCHNNSRKGQILEGYQAALSTEENHFTKHYSLKHPRCSQTLDHKNAGNI